MWFLWNFTWSQNLFPQLMALLISNISLQSCYCESFTANSYFLLKIQKYSPTDVFPFTVTVLNNILLLLTQNHLPIAQASSSFKLLDTYVYAYLCYNHLYNWSTLSCYSSTAVFNECYSELMPYTVPGNSYAVSVYNAYQFQGHTP